MKAKSQNYDLGANGIQAPSVLQGVRAVEYMQIVLSCCCCKKKNAWQKQFKKGLMLTHSSRVQAKGNHGGNDNLLASTLEKQRALNASTQNTFFLFSQRPQPMKGLPAVKITPIRAI